MRKGKPASFEEAARVGSSSAAATNASGTASNRQRNRSLKKSPAVQDDDPSHHHLIPQEPRRAASFDVAAGISSPKVPPASFRPGSFDASRSAFSPVEVPRLLVQSPLSPLQLERPPPTDSRLLTVPSPDFRKSPSDNRSYSCESPKGGMHQTTPSDVFALGNLGSIPPSLLNQLSVAMQHQALGLSSPLLDDFKIQSAVPKLEQMDCSGSFETVGSGSFELPTNASFDQTHHNGQATPEIMAQMPPKSIIQDDIRNSNGRFQLVRKRGRSEVWNLFGQVLDTMTQVRLPYVACYACKVLYTDTGGGTGNMTRHRCPIGASYRSGTHGSSTETVDPGCPGSFESTASATTTTTTTRAEPRPQISLTSVDNEPHHSRDSEFDKEILTEALVKCCALDLIDPVVFNGKGFRGLISKIMALAKRGNNQTSIDTFPDIATVKSAMQTHLRFCTDDLKNELSRTTQGVRLTLETLTYCDKVYRVIHGSRISPDWKWRSNILGVFKCKDNESIKDMINIVVHNYELDKNLLRVTTPNANHDLAPIKTFIDIKSKLMEILATALSASSLPVTQMLQAIDQLTKMLVDLDVRLPFDYEKTEDVFDVHRLLAEWNDRWSQIEQIISSKCPHLLTSFKIINPSHMRDLEAFIMPFRETIESLIQEQPNFQKVLPEWFALMHECQVSDDEPSPLLRELKTKATELLKSEMEQIITDEHRIAAILNPRLSRKLNMILTESERNTACEKIRAMCGIRNPSEPLSRGSSCDGEPHRKRRMFLSSLEDDPVGDELECYLRSQYPPQQTKDVITFWSTIGQTQFPSLASLARRTLSTPATAPKTSFDPSCASVAPDQLHTFLMLRSMFDSDGN
ncbi:unnamed protein product [Caenorhabditis bovis]|uniref:BED-type domain-containing protein n=1 Tax=Caenorhabditis bovis TaxID=2654633 RepID=A0A8S1F0L0_9PELO|nr:unnamed protein product [Caenorhabditis bovis]